MDIQIKLFSHLKYKLGKDVFRLEVQHRITAGEIKFKIYELGGPHISNIPFRVAVNGNFVHDDYIIQDLDQIALIPPVQGG